MDRPNVRSNLHGWLFSGDKRWCSPAPGQHPADHRCQWRVVSPGAQRILERSTQVPRNSTEGTQKRSPHRRFLRLVSGVLANPLTKSDQLRVGHFVKRTFGDTCASQGKSQVGQNFTLFDSLSREKVKGKWGGNWSFSLALPSWLGPFSASPTSWAPYISCGFKHHLLGPFQISMAFLQGGDV